MKEYSLSKAAYVTEVFDRPYTICWLPYRSIKFNGTAEHCVLSSLVQARFSPPMLRKGPIPYRHELQNGAVSSKMGKSGNIQSPHL